MNKQAQNSRGQGRAQKNQCKPASATAMRNVKRLAGLLCERDDLTREKWGVLGKYLDGICIFPLACSERI